MKRKACELEESNTINPWSSVSPVSDSSLYNGSPQRPLIRPVAQMFAPLQSYSMSSSLNLRTRKRFRDNRPDAEVIHQNTISKLFNAQRQSSSCHSPVQMPHTDEQTSINQYAQNQMLPETNQRSIDSFFTLRRSQQSSAACRKPASLHNYIHTEQSGLLCEGCGSLLSYATDSLQHAPDTMEIDRVPGLDLEDDYRCANCSRNFCDMCAVRGDHRICLECAIPGGG